MDKNWYRLSVSDPPPPFPIGLVLILLLLAAAVWIILRMRRSAWVELTARVQGRDISAKQFELDLSADGHRIALARKEGELNWYDLEAPNHSVERRMFGIYLCQQSPDQEKPKATKLQLGVATEFERREGETVALTINPYEPPAEEKPASDETV
jgi:hypothetical protein